MRAIMRQVSASGGNLLALEPMRGQVLHAEAYDMAAAVYKGYARHWGAHDG